MKGYLRRTPGTRADVHREASELEEVVEEARALAEKLGLQPYPVKYWVVDYDDVNEAVALGGFQERYPHWRWGMEYERQSKVDRYTPARIYELVVNDDPCHAYLQVTNDAAVQKAVITHVEAHADSFRNNDWFQRFTGGFDAAATLARHASTIESYCRRGDVDREEVERWIDTVISLEDNIDQYSALEDPADSGSDSEAEELRRQVEEMELSDEVRDEVFTEEWLERQDVDDDLESVPATPEKDLLGFLAEHGMAYDEDSGRAVEMEDWQRDIIRMLRREAYYFAPQKMTKVMNEGWAAYWESTMMAAEAFAEDDEFLDYADHQAKVLSSDGLNPYSLGKELWEYVENQANRREVTTKLLRVEGATPDNLHDKVALDEVEEKLEPRHPLSSLSSETLDDLEELPDGLVDHGNLQRARQGDVDADRHPWKLLTYEGLAERHYSLTRLQNKGFLRDVTASELEDRYRYMADVDVYASAGEALEDVDRTAGWRAMKDVRATHNDVTFIDEYLTEEFVDRHGYFAYEHSEATGQYHVSSRGFEDVKKKLLLHFTNFGKPTVKVHGSNYDNAGELLLVHHYNGVPLDLEEAEATLERVHRLWGRAINLKTVTRNVEESVMKMAKRRGKEPDTAEKGLMLRYDGSEHTWRELDEEEYEELLDPGLDYDTRPEDWLN